MITVQILESEDVIQKGDWVRYTEIEYIGQGDHVHTSSTYGGTPINFFRWLPVEKYCPHFIGKKLKKYEKTMYGMETQSQYVARKEFIRGPVPDTHQYNGPLK